MGILLAYALPGNAALPATCSITSWPEWTSFFPPFFIPRNAIRMQPFDAHVWNIPSGPARFFKTVWSAEAPSMAHKAAVWPCPFSALSQPLSGLIYFRVCLAPEVLSARAQCPSTLLLLHHNTLNPSSVHLSRGGENVSLKASATCEAMVRFLLERTWQTPLGDSLICSLPFPRVRKVDSHPSLLSECNAQADIVSILLA